MDEAQGGSVSTTLGFRQELLVEQPSEHAQQRTLTGEHAPNGATSTSAGSSNMSQSNFSTVNVEAAAALTCLSSYNEIVGKLNRLWDDQLTQIQGITDEHWKNPEFPLARIKKIMRMDEEVKMISAEVPLMFSKAVEIFVTELSLRAWLHTEESKRRTVQRSDIAIAITKHDMFDFLIDIVPREEIQLKSKPAVKQGENEQLQLLTPELLQLYLQHLAQQHGQQQQQQPQQQQQQQQQEQPGQQQQQQQQQHEQHGQQQQQQEAQQQLHQEPQIQQQVLQQLVSASGSETVAGGDDQTSKILQDNMALIQQLQQLLQLQLQMQQLQEQAGGEQPSTLADTQTLQLQHPPVELEHHSHSIATSVLNQPDQVLATSTDNIHRVTINVANDLLEPDPQTSLSTSQPLHHMNPSPSSSSQLHQQPLFSSASHLPQQEQTTTMIIQPHLLEQGSADNSPSSLLSNEQSQYQLQQQLEAQLSTVLVQGTEGVSPEQYIVQASPVLEGTAVVPSIAVNSGSSSHSPSVTLHGVTQPAVELHHIVKDNPLSHSLTPIDATLQPTSQSEEVLYQNIAGEVSLGPVAEGTTTLTTLKSSLPS